jgi:hypothetical protein
LSTSTTGIISGDMFAVTADSQTYLDRVAASPEYVSNDERQYYLTPPEVYFASPLILGLLDL